MFTRDNIREAFKAALPIMLGYIAIGLPCGILSSSIGMDVVQVLLLSVFFYSGAGQFMIPNMWIRLSPIASIVASVSLVNTRQMLYSASFAPWCQGVSRKLAFWFAASVTDESFGVNMQKFLEGGWSVQKATLVNEMSHSSWTISCIVGVIVGNAIGVPQAIAAFAMTSIFICLLVTQKLNAPNIVAAVAAIVGVIVCKLVGLAGPAILIGAVFGVVCALAFSRLRPRSAVAQPGAGSGGASGAAPGAGSPAEGGR